MSDNSRDDYFNCINPFIFLNKLIWNYASVDKAVTGEKNEQAFSVHSSGDGKKSNFSCKF